MDNSDKKQKTIWNIINNERGKSTKRESKYVDLSPETFNEYFSKITHYKISILWVHAIIITQMKKKLGILFKN